MLKNMAPDEAFGIREYRIGDYKQVSDLWLKTGLTNKERADSELTIHESIILGGALLILEEKSNGKLCGTSWMTYDGRRVHLHHFGILNEYQGRGLAKMLLVKSLEFVRKKGCQVKIEVERSNLKAMNLYTKYGFKPLGDYDVLIIRNPAYL